MTWGFAFIITIIVLYIIEVVIFNLTYRSDEERRQNGYKLNWMLAITIIGGILVYLSAAPTVCSPKSSSDGQRAEYGFFGKKKPVVEPVPRTNYGNPMKSQNYAPKSGIKVEPKTDRSRIFSKFGA
jgi:hypothetical protein